MNKQHIKNIIALLVTIIFSVFVLYKIDISEMIATFKLFNLRYLFFLIPFFMILMVIRAKRWDIILPKNKCSIFNLYKIYMVSNLLNIFLPARAGDIFRGFYFGYQYNLSKMNVLGTVAAERIFDGITVIAMLIIGILLYNKSQFAIELVAMASILFFSSFFVLFWIYKYDKINTICHFLKKHFDFLPQKYHEKICYFIDKINPILNSFMLGFKSFTDIKTLLSVFLLSILAWGMDCIFLYISILAFGIKVNFLITLFILSFIALSTIIPSSSIYVGLYQYAFILAADLFNIDKSQALSISIMGQGIMLIGYFIILGLFLIQNQVDIKEINKEIQDESK